MRVLVGICLCGWLLLIPTGAGADHNGVVVHDSVIVEESVDVYEGFRSPNEMVYIFVLIVLLSVIGLGMMNAIE